MRAKQPRRGATRKPEKKAPRVVNWRRGVMLLLLMVLVTTGLLVGRDVQQHVIAMQWFKLKVAQIEGRFDYVDRADVRAIVGQYAGLGFFDVDVNSLRDELEALPWVHHAMVRRVWPDTLNVEVHEQTVVARWNDDALINREGHVFTPSVMDPRLQKFPQLYGSQGRSEMLLTRLREMNELLQAVDTHVVMLKQDRRGAWQLELDNDVELMLGRNNEMQRMRRFVKFYPRMLIVGAHPVSKVDLRYNSGFVVRSSLNKGKG